MDGSTVRLAWDPVVLQHWGVDHYTIYHNIFSTSTRKTVDQNTLFTLSTENSKVFILSHIDPKFEHHFEVTVSIIVEGEEFESPRSTLLIFTFGEN